MGRWRETWEREGEARGCEIVGWGGGGWGVGGGGAGGGYRGGEGIE